MPAPETARAITEVGAGQCVIASDGGQALNPAAPQMLLEFAESLARAGIPESTLRQMMKDNPAYLLDV